MNKQAMSRMRTAAQARNQSLPIIGKPKPRSCGDCVSCCTTLRVILPTTLLELPEGMERPTKVKESGEACPHCDQGTATRLDTGKPALGCAIYRDKNRPQECSAFQCAWLQSAPGFTGAMRPDKLGLYGYADRIPGGHGPGMYFVEVEEGAFGKPAAREVMREYVLRVPAMRIYANGQAELGLPGRMVPIVASQERDTPSILRGADDGEEK